MNRLNTNAIADRLMARVPATVAASLADFKQVTPTLARVVFAFNTLEARREDKFAAVCAALSNQARPVDYSFREVSSFGRPAMVGFITLNREVKAYSEAAAKRMQALSSNMLMDTSDDSLWEIRSDGSGNKMLARQQMDNLSELLVTAHMRQKSPKLAQMASAADRGNFVAFVDPNTDVLRYGYVVATDLSITPQPVGGTDVDVDAADAVEILMMPTGMPENQSDETINGDGVEDRVESCVVATQFIVEAARMNGSDVHEEVAAPDNSQSAEAMKQYYKELYQAWAPDYYADVVRQINEHAGL